MRPARHLAEDEEQAGGWARERGTRNEEPRHAGRRADGPTGGTATPESARAAAHVANARAPRSRRVRRTPRSPHAAPAVDPAGPAPALADGFDRHIAKPPSLEALDAMFAEAPAAAG